MTTTKQKTNHKSTSRAIAWEGLERPPAKRWWWYLGFGYVSFLGIALLISLDQWAFAITMTAAAGAAFVVYIGKPRGVKARLTSTSLIVNGQEFPLANYRSFRIDNVGAHGQAIVRIGQCSCDSRSIIIRPRTLGATLRNEDVDSTLSGDRDT